MDLNELEVTTKDAIKRIKDDLRKGDYISALLLSAIYMDIRSRTLLTNRLQPDEAKWKKIHSELDDIRGPKTRLSICENLNLVSHQVAKDLKDLWDTRGDVAHTSRIWRNPTEEDITKIDRLCKVALQFFEDTGH